MAQITWRYLKGPGHADGRRRLHGAADVAAGAAITEMLSEVRNDMLEHGNVPQYDESDSRELDTPERGQRMIHFTANSKTFYETIAKTLIAAYNLPVSWPKPSHLLAVLADQSPEWLHDGDISYYGIFSRAKLDEATRYQAKLIILPSADPTGKMAHLWWDWTTRTWQSATFLLGADGSVTPVTQQTATAFDMSHGWRGAVNSDSGYWADVEFGSRWAQVPAEMIPGPGQNLVELFIGNPGLGIHPAEIAAGPYNGWLVGNHAYQFLSQAAWEVATMSRDPKGQLYQRFKLWFARMAPDFGGVA